jgi:hypothetical protein
MGKILCFLVSLLLLVTLVLNGCASKEGVITQTTTKVVTAEDILNNAVSAMGKVTTYKLDYDLSTNMEVTGKNAMKMNMNGGGPGVMDITNQKMQMSMDMNMTVPGIGTSEMNVKMSMEIYLFEGWVYTKMTIPGTEVQWIKTKNPDNITQDQVAQMTTLMKSSMKTTLTGTETINGINCYVLEVTPDMGQLWQWLMSQQGNDLIGDIDYNQFDLSKIIKSFGLKYWIDKNNYQILQAEADMNMLIDAQTVGAATEEFDSMTMIMTMNMSFFDYNKAVNVELPAEAANAQEISP